MSARPPWVRLGVLAVALGLGTWLRLRGLADLPLHGDEHHTLFAADAAYREILTLKHVNGMPYGEIAAFLGATVPSVESMLFKARRALRAEVARLLAREREGEPRMMLAEAGARMRQRVLVDGRNMLDPEELRSHGFEYEGIGRAAV
mgnify:CR=1 FL=1